MDQLTREQAIAYNDSEAWKSLDAKQRFAFQLEQDYLCMPLAQLRAAAQEALGRHVWTHEFENRERVGEEFAGRIAAPSKAEIICMLPTETTILVDTEEEQR